MKNTKVKGFTLIELIIVIAIIGIIAAILVPSMIGYIRNSRISEANANAKQVHTAVGAALIQMAVADVPLTETSLVFTGNPNGQCTINGYDLEVGIYLGEDFRGTGYAEFKNIDTYAIDFATWVPEGKPAHTVQETEAKQKADAKTNNFYGVFPLALP